MLNVLSAVYRIGALCAIALLSACCHNPVSPREALIRERCPPLVSVLQKNYDFTLKAMLLGTGIGAGAKSSGPVLSSEQAERQLITDRMCRAWVAGELTSREFTQHMTTLAAASVAGLPAASTQAALDQQQQAIEEIAAVLNRLLENGNQAKEPVPNRAELAANIKTEVKEFESKGMGTLRETLASAFSRFGEKSAAPMEYQTQLIRELTVRVAILQSAIDHILTQGFNAAPAVTRKNNDGDDVRATGRPLLPPPFRVFFRAGAVDISSAEQERLKHIYRGLDFSRLVVEISGFADSSGHPGLNEQLSQKRAMVVRDFLIDELQVRPTKIQAIGRVIATDRIKPREENRSAEVRLYYE